MEHKTYMVRWGRNQYRVYRWEEGVHCYREGPSLPYGIARIVVGTDNCQNPETCTKETHQH